jgi:hypothetical protein
MLNKCIHGSHILKCQKKGCIENKFEYLYLVNSFLLELEEQHEIQDALARQEMITIRTKTFKILLELAKEAVIQAEEYSLARTQEA